MKQSLKLLTIGLVVSLLVVSHASFGGTTSAAPITSLSQDTMEWLDTSKEIVKFYKTGDEAVFFLADNDLANIKTGRATWTNLVQAVPSGALFDIASGQTESIIGGGLTTPNASTTTYRLVQTDYSTTSPETTPQNVAPAVTIDGSGAFSTGFGGVSPTTAGTFKLFDAVAVTSTVVATFTYDIQDVYAAAAPGATIATANNRAKVTSTSDATGEWITISEVTALGVAATSRSAISKLFRGSVEVSGDAAATAAGDAKVWVQDGDTLTVTYYASDHTTVIDSTTATIDATVPAVINILPTDGSIEKSAAPSVTFSITDSGSGLSTADPGSNVDLFVTVGGNDCPVDDVELFFPSRTASQLDVAFSSAIGVLWSTAATGGCLDRVAGGFGIDTTTLGFNNHGVALNWRIDATDEAGNTFTVKGASLDLTVDTVAPDMKTGQTGKGWDSTNRITKTQLDSIMLTFDESLDPATVAAADFLVDGVAPSAVLVAGVNATVAATTLNQLKDEFVFLTMPSNFTPSARPKVEIVGSVSDKAGNALAPPTGATVADNIASADDGITATVSGVTYDAKLLAKDGEAKIDFTSDESLTGTADPLGFNLGCTCLAVAGGGVAVTTGANKLAVTLTTPTMATATFQQQVMVTTAIYGVIIQARDLAGNNTNVGAVKVTDEDVSSLIVAGNTGTTTTVKLAKWPIADSDADGTLADEFTVTINNVAVATTIANAVDWSEAETVTLVMSTAVAVGDTMKVTYNYVDAAQVVEVDVSAPGISFVPASGSTTEDARPFVSIIFDDDEYAGDTFKTVTVTSAILKDPNGASIDIMPFLATTDNITFIYTPPADLLLGDYTVTAKGRDQAGNESAEVAGKFTIKARALKSIALRPGWNLVSLPGDPASTAINDVITVAQVDVVLTYEPTAPGGWLTAVRDADGNLTGTLNTVDATKGYWVHTTTFDPIKVDIPGLAGGAAKLPPSLALVKGWNLVPAVSLNPAFAHVDADTYFSGLNWTRGYSYNAAARAFEGFIPATGADTCTAFSAADVSTDCVKTGKGYWVFLIEAGTLVP